MTNVEPIADMLERYIGSLQDILMPEKKKFFQIFHGLYGLFCCHKDSIHGTFPSETL